MMGFRLLRGDCIDMMRTLPDCSVDSIVTDPPYGLSFMGQHWDYDVPSVDVWREAMRVLKPGGHLLAFAGSRTYHRMAVNIEDAGFEIRDQIMWVYGSGFPKSLDVSKAIDKLAGVTFDASNQWQGWGTALKPSHEPVVVARKPLSEKTVAANVLMHGTGALNIDACRVPLQGEADAAGFENNHRVTERLPKEYDGQPLGLHDGGWKQRVGDAVIPSGRWPANLIHDGSDEVVACFPQTGPSAGGFKAGSTGAFGKHGRYGSADGIHDDERTSTGFGDTGSAARFFYAAKASKKDRGEGNTHPTVKPVAVCAYLQKLVTPPGGVTLDMYCGSGSFGVSAMGNGFHYIGIDRDIDADGNPLGYLDIARQRILHAQCEASGL